MKRFELIKLRERKFIWLQVLLMLPASAALCGGFYPGVSVPAVGSRVPSGCVLGAASELLALLSASASVRHKDDVLIYALFDLSFHYSCKNKSSRVFKMPGI